VAAADGCHDDMRKPAQTLIESAIAGDTAAVKMAVAMGADPHAVSTRAPCNAAEYGHTEVIRFLLAAGADVNAKASAALRIAAIFGRAEVVRILLAAGANPMVAWKNATLASRDRVATMLDACDDALTTKQIAVLLAAAGSDGFIKLRAMAASTRKNQMLCH